MHGAGGGAPKGNKNALRHGLYTAEAVAMRQAIRLSLISADPKEHQREPTGILALSCLFVVRGRFGRVLNRPHNRDCGPEEN